MGKKDKLGIEKILNKINKEFDKSTKHIEKLMSEAMEQFETLQQQIHEPVKKLLEDAESIRDREVKRLQDEFERRMDEFTQLQQSILKKFGLRKTKHKAQGNSSPPAEASHTPAPKVDAEKPVKKTATSRKRSTVKSDTPARKTPTKKAATRTSKPKVNDSDLTRLKGVGPAIAKKMNAAGIHSLKQIANPTDEDKKLLEQFSRIKGADTWPEQAKALLS